MARCCLSHSLQNNQNQAQAPPANPNEPQPIPTISLSKQKPCCTCYKMPPAPTKKIKKVQIGIPNFIFETWPLYADCLKPPFSKGFHEMLMTKVSKALEEPDEPNPNQYEWENDLPVEIVIELVPGCPLIYELNNM